MKAYTADHYSNSYFSKFRRPGLMHKQLLMAIDRKEPVFRALVKTFPRSASLMDFGCGAGWFLRHAEHYFTTVGIDFSKEALKMAKSNAPKTHFIFGDQRVLSQIKDRSFDLITSFDVLEHVEKPEKLLTEFKRLLKDNGVLVIAVPNGNSWFREKLQKKWSGYADPSHIWFLTEQEWRILLYQQGFTFVKRYNTGLVNHPTPPYSLHGVWFFIHALTQLIALSGLPLPNTLNDDLIMSFRKIE